MIASFLDYFSKNHFMPHGHCYLWKPGILWLHVISDVVIALSYFSIPLMLYYFVYKKKNLPHPRIFRLFAAFIFWCGLTHIISIWTVWDPIYQIEGIAKGITAAISLATALVLFPVVPQLLALRSPKELDELNKQLKSALEEKEKAEEELKKKNETLEEEVAKRTSELSRYIKRLDSANSELESFAYQASHDLKSPLSSLISYFDELDEAPKNQEKFNEFFPRMKRQLKHLEGLITDLLELSRLGSKEITKEWLRIDDILSDSKLNLHHLIEEKNAKIYADQSFDIYGNKTQMVLVFQNLLENALKYSKSSEPPEIMISAHDEGGYWRFEFKDNGIGIEDDKFHSIFKPFQRLHSNDEYPGTGLGLSICKKVIELHGGTIEVESSNTQGTSFVFALIKDFEK